jgi:hypothetical protein
VDKPDIRRAGGAPRRFDVREEADRKAPDAEPRTTIRRLPRRTERVPRSS